MNRFIEFEAKVEAIKARCTNGEISETERDAILRQTQLRDEQWGDIWLLSPKGQWFRKANGSTSWIADYPVLLVDPTTMPAVAEMDAHQIARAVHDCTNCPLHAERRRAVPGEGPVPTDIMLIGEGPGSHEDQQARPFVGASGKLLEELLGNIGKKRTEVFIANVIKCRPPGNRDPLPDELAACRNYLDRQLELVNPKVIVTLGRFSMARYFPGASISKIHGQPKRVGDRLVVPMFHPAAALRNPNWRPLLIEDFRRLPEFIKEAASFHKETVISTEQISLL